MADIKLTSINAPGLNISNYGEHIDQQFTNIDSNFKKIVGTDFLKGNQGDSMQIIEVEFNKTNYNSTGLYLNGKDLKHSDIYNQIKSAILTDIDENKETGGGILSPINEVNWDDYLSTCNKITIIYRLDGDTNKKHVISALYYTFYDARFSNIQYQDVASYNGVVDTSCLVCLQTETNSRGEGDLKFKKLNVFPTLYYNEDIHDASNDSGTFCWIINGNKTEIPAVGPRGKTGNMGTVYLVKVVESINSNYSYITKVLHINGTEAAQWEDLDDFLKRDIYFGEGSCVLAIKEMQQKDSTRDLIENRLWISPVYVREESGAMKYYAFCDDSNSVLGVFNTDQLLHSMSDIYDSVNLHGLFVPITKIDNNNSQSAHMIYALPSTSGSKINNHLYIAPVKNIHQYPWYTKWNDQGADILGKTGLYDVDNSVMSFLYKIVNVDNNLKVNNSLFIGNTGVAFNSTETGANIYIPDGKYLTLTTNESPVVNQPTNSITYPIQMCDVAVSGNLLVTESIDVQNVFTNDINITGDFSSNYANIETNLTVNENAHIVGDLQCDNNIIANAITSKGNVSLTNGLLTVSEDKINMTTDINIHEPQKTEADSDNNPNKIILHKTNKADDLINNVGQMSYDRMSVYDFKPIVSNTIVAEEINRSSFIDFWNNPLIKKSEDNKWKGDQELSIGYTKNDIIIWERNKGNDTDKVKLFFNRDLSVLFTVSGRNLYSNPWLLKAVWTKPKWTTAKYTLEIKAVLEDGSTSSLLKLSKTTYPNIYLFNMNDKKVYENDSTAEKNGYGDTAVCVFSITPNKNEYEYTTITKDNKTINRIYANLNIELEFNRNLTNNEDSNKYEVWKSIKILGIFSSQQSANGTVETKVLGRLSDFNDVNKLYPLDDQKTPQPMLDKIITPEKYDDIKYILSPNTPYVVPFAMSYKLKAAASQENICHICPDGILFIKGSTYFALHMENDTDTPTLTVKSKLGEAKSKSLYELI